MSVREDRPSMMVMHPRKSVQRKIAARRQRGARREDRNPCAGYMMGSADAASARSHDAQPHGAWILSRRELEVLRLVASGETDRAIADALFVSMRTVNSHVSTILAKLDVSSRCAAVMTAARIGLL
jgi:DNA-binding NarL/FixJ family response regulator